MDQFTRRIIGFAVRRGAVDGLALCRMFNRAIRGQTAPKYVSSDHDPLYRFHQWQANLRVMEVTEIKTVPYVPLSHPFVERLIGTVRREYLDQMLFWTGTDLEDKLLEFQHYYNAHRTHEARAEARLNRSATQPTQLCISVLMPGSAIVEGCIRHLLRRKLWVNSPGTSFRLPQVIELVSWVVRNRLPFTTCLCGCAFSMM
jgi:hypothetical protein